MRHVMIDIETAATCPDATILSIGVVDTCGTEAEWRLSRHQKGRAVCVDTMLWWAKQDVAVRNIAFNGESDLDRVLIELAYYLKSTHEFRIWAKPASFDLTILAHAFGQQGISVPWHFRDERCLRTAIKLSQMYVLERDEVKYPPHSALADAQWQLEQLRHVTDIGTLT